MASPIAIDPYEVLGVAKNAELSAIRSAHRKLALKFHPDRIKDESLRKKGTEEFQKAQQAYEILSDEKRRARYDDQVKLAQLKKEAMERGGPTRSTSYPTAHPHPAHPAAPPRTNSSTYEYSSARTYENGRMYEERRPRYSEDDDRYAEPPRSTRKPPSYERKPSHAFPEEKKKKGSSVFSSFVESKVREKAQKARERASAHEAAKARDKDRRHDSFEKSTRRNAYVEDDDTSSDSDTIRPSRRPEPPRRSKTYYEEAPRRKPSPPPRRHAKYASEASSSESSDDGDYDSSRDEWARKHQFAANYISERSVSGKPSVLQGDSAKYYSKPREDSGRKSGSEKEDRRAERRDERPRSAKTSRPVEIVDPPKRSPQSRKTAPPMKTANSSPAGLKHMTREEAPRPQRAATGEYQAENRRPIPAMNRSQTMPVQPSSRKDPTPNKGSKLKHTETHDSGYGSSGPNTPELYGTSPPKGKSSSTRHFFVVEEDPEHARSRAVPLNDNYPSRRTRSPSPPGRDRDREDRRDKDKDRKRQDRPSLQTNTSYATTRSSPYTLSPEQMSSRPQAFRTDSSRSTVTRETPPLSRGDSGGRRGYGESKEDPYRIKVDPDKVRYARHGKSDAHTRDYYPGSTHADNLHVPKNGRRESAY